MTGPAGEGPRPTAATGLNGTLPGYSIACATRDHSCSKTFSSCTRPANSTTPNPVTASGWPTTPTTRKASTCWPCSGASAATWSRRWNWHGSHRACARPGGLPQHAGQPAAAAGPLAAGAGVFPGRTASRSHHLGALVGSAQAALALGDLAAARGPWAGRTGLRTTAGCACAGHLAQASGDQESRAPVPGGPEDSADDPTIHMSLARSFGAMGRHLRRAGAGQCPQAEARLCPGAGCAWPVAPQGRPHRRRPHRVRARPGARSGACRGAGRTR